MRCNTAILYQSVDVFIRFNGFQIFIIIAHGHQLWILNHQILLIILVVNVGQRALLGVTLHLVGELKLVKYCIMQK